MKQYVLMIAYFFPPEGSAGTYRSLRFARQLVKCGWAPVVICAEPYSYERYDPELLKLVPNGVEVIRVRARDLWQAVQSWRGKRFQEALAKSSGEVAQQMQAAQYHPIRSLVRRAIRLTELFYYHPDLARGWIRPAVDSAVKLCKRKRLDVIWASAGPVSAWLVARKISRATGIPYVLDLRDPHGLSYYDPEVRRPDSVMRRMRRTMHQVFKEAQGVVFLFDSVAECYSRAFPDALDAAKIHIIPNGYEGCIDNSVPSSSDRLNVLYTGTVVSYRYDTLLHALAELKSEAPATAQKLRLRFIGEGMEDVAKLAARLGLSNIVETAGPTSHAEITRLEREAHALLVLGRLPAIAGHELFAGAKVFNYLKTNRPIFAVVPRDETKKVLERVGVSTIADADSPAEIAKQLERLIKAWSSGTLPSLLPHRDQCECYSAERQTEALVRALEGDRPAQAFVYGRVEVPPSLRARVAEGAARMRDYGWN
ncbi:MAG TPA: glycosyltransferase [Candidatus Binatia bacterium]